MSFSTSLLVLAAIIYVLIGADQAIKHNAGMAIAYFAYAVANAAMILLAK